MGGHFQHRLSRFSYQYGSLQPPLTQKQFRLRDAMVCGEVYYYRAVHYVTIIIIIIIIAVIVIKIINAVSEQRRHT
jgi:hypothetical protein